MRRGQTAVITGASSGMDVTDDASVTAGFADVLAGDDAPDPQLVVDAYLALASAPAGTRATRTVVGLTWGVDEINARTQPLQDNILREMQFDGVLLGANA